MKRPSRVLLFAPHFAEYALRLAHALSEDVEVLLILDRTNLLQECAPELIRKKSPKLRILAYSYRNTAFRAFWFFTICLRAMLFRPDIVHAQEQADRSSLRIIRFLGARFALVLTVHDPKPHSGADAEIAQRVAGVRNAMRATANGFHVHGDYCRSELAESAGQTPICTTQHGVILEPSQQERRAPNQNRVLFFGRMAKYKGIDVLLDSAAILNERRFPCEFLLAGRGSELDILRSRAEALPNVSILEKYLSPVEAIEQFQQAALVVAPYRDATQSGVVAAAVANGRPIVATRAGGLVDSVTDGETGVLLPVGDPLALADALQDLLARPDEWNRMAANVRDAAMGLFSWRNISSVLLSFYTQIYAARHTL